MTDFRPQISVPSTSAGSRRGWPWLAGGAAVAATVILLVLGSPDESPDTAGPALTATRAASTPSAPAAARIASLPPPDPYRPDPAGKAVLEELTLAPARTASGATGYVVTKADAELLAATPLREGDVILELDGQKLDPARLAKLGEELGDYDDLWVSFERDGKTIETLLELRRR